MSDKNNDKTEKSNPNIDETDHRPIEKEHTRGDIDDSFITGDIIREYSNNNRIIKYVKDNFKRINRTYSIKLVVMILRNMKKITIKKLADNSKTFYQYNMGKIEKTLKNNKEIDYDNSYLKEEIVNEIKQGILELLKKLGQKIPIHEDGYYLITSDMEYEQIRRLVCDEGGMLTLRYNFNEPDMELKPIRNISTLQRSYIQVVSTGVKFDYPVEYKYYCYRCDTSTEKKSYATISTGTKILCEGIYNYINASGEPKSKICGLSLKPDAETAGTKSTFYYEINYESVHGDNINARSISFNNIKPGFYECVLFKIKNPKGTEMFHIIDLKPINNNVFNIPEKKGDENYVFTLQKSFDNYIKQQTNFEIWGLYPIKVSLILQALNSYLGFDLNVNIQMVGDASTGKSTVLKYYGYLLYNHLHLTTNGMSTSIPGMRGTRESVYLLGKEEKIITAGFLGIFKSIHIDEAGDNQDLIKDLKSFLMETNYGYDKAGSTGTNRRRTAQMNISENLNQIHLGQYRGGVKKAYRDFSLNINDEEKPEWDESWDLHLPLYKYENPYLYKIIKDKRREYAEKRQYWIDGYELALHERFLFYFYIVNGREIEGLNRAVKGNVARNVVKENMELMKCLKTDNIITFFESLKEYVVGKNEEKSFDKVDDILNSYGFHCDSRIKSFFYNLVKLSRIINKRFVVEEQDYDLVRWFLEKMNQKLDLCDTCDYKINGPPNLEEIKEKEKIAEETSKIDNVDSFDVPDDEFD